MRRCALLGRATFTLILAAASHSTAESTKAQYLNGTRYHSEAIPGLSMPQSTAQHTTATITEATESGSSSTTTLQTPTTTNQALDGCSTDCTFDDTYMTQNPNSWTKCQGTVMIGRVHYFVDAANNKTSTSTDFAQQVTFSQNGTRVTSDVTNILASGSQILTRTDVNAAGTVTHMDGTNTMAYPTGFNVLPSFYVWNGILPYTTNGSTACAKAGDTTMTFESTNTWTESRSSSVIGTHTDSMTRTVFGATPIPSVSNLPTQSVYGLDEQDPKGWTYCYAFGRDAIPGDDFFSLFSGSLFDQLRNNCTRKASAAAPLVVVSAAAFLLDETTSYIDNTKTENSEVLRTRTTEPSQTPTNVLVDPIQSASKSSNVHKSASPEEAKPTSSTTTKLAQTMIPSTIGQSNPGQSVSGNSPVEPAQTMVPPSSFRESSVSATAIKPSAQDTEIVDKASQQDPTTSAEVRTKMESPIAVQTTATSGSVQLDALNSFIQEIGELQSTSDRGVVASLDGPSTQAKTPPTNTATATATASMLPAPIVIGTSTATVNSDGNFMIGTHALQPTDSPYILQGTTYALDPSENALVVSGFATYAVLPAEQASDSAQAATLVINGIIATPASASAYLVQTQTLRPGGPAITVSGTRISLASDAAAVVIGSQTSVLSKIVATHAVEPAHHTSDSPQPATLTINGVAVIANSASNYIVETQTLRPGGPAITVSGTRISLASDAAAVVVGSETSVLSRIMATHAVEPAHHTGNDPPPATLTINGMTATVNSASAYVLETQTLKPGGPAITVSGTRISLASNAATVVVGSQTSALSKTMGIGDYVWAGLAGMLSAASDSASLASRLTVLESSQTASAQDGSILPATTPTASDGEDAFNDSSVNPLTSPNPSSTGVSTTDRVATQQTTTSIPNPGTTSPSGSDFPSSPSSSSSSSSSSNSIETQPENNSGRVAMSATFAICFLTLTVVVFA